MQTTTQAEAIYFNGQFVTLDHQQPRANAVAIKDGKFLAVGAYEEVNRHQGPTTAIIDLHNQQVLPGLHDSHIHLIRGGLNYNLELRWDGVPSLSDALDMLRKQAQRTPTPQWVRVVGGFTEHQFAEKRLPTLDEILRHEVAYRSCST
jgi:predicted amidohydrolase YtcJ